MKILFAASEAAPFIKTGGLGDVASALPAELSKIQGNEVAVFIPYYSAIKYNKEIKAEYITSFTVPLAWRNIYCGIFKAKRRIGRKSVTYYFLDNEYYFGRGHLYGDTDDGEKFAFFSKAILESLQHIGFYPDIIHCNDWQTAFLPLFYKAFYRNINEYSNIKIVYTIHNIEYQGKADPGFLPEVLGVSEYWRGVVSFDGLINAMKSAIVLCDKLTTVSPTYSHEILYAYFAHGLEKILQENSYKLVGILNGIDTKVFDPKTDKNIYKNFEHGDIALKAENKKFLQQQLGLEVSDQIPMFAMISRFVPHKGIDLVERVIEDMAQMNIQLVLLGTGYENYENTFKYYDYAYHNKISANIKFDGPLANMIYAGADYFLMPSKSEPCGLAQMIAMRYGTVPIVREVGGLYDTVPPIDMETLKGRGFTFKTYNAYDMLDAVRRAESFFYQTEKRAAVVDNIMKEDFGWKNSAKKYMNIYTELVGG